MTTTKHYYLERIGPDAESERYCIAALPCTIGRGNDCELQLDLERISRRHALFMETAEGLRLQDLASTNGTFVNHERVEAPVDVRPGDHIHFADHQFALVHDDSHGDTVQMLPPGHGRSDETVVGFTEAPTGFPVQAPEFYELLNDEAVIACRRPIRNAGRMVSAWLMNARSAHPRLLAEQRQLVRLSEQLGEEVRLHQIIRKTCARAADDEDMDDLPLLIRLHPMELEDIDVLIDDIEALQSSYRRLNLIYEAPMNVSEEGSLATLAASLRGLDLDMGIFGVDPSSPRELEIAAQHGDWIRFSLAAGEAIVAAAIGALKSGTARIVLDDTNDAELVERFAAMPRVLFSGPWAGDSEALAQD